MQGNAQKADNAEVGKLPMEDFISDRVKQSKQPFSPGGGGKNTQRETSSLFPPSPGWKGGKHAERNRELPFLMQKGSERGGPGESSPYQSDSQGVPSPAWPECRKEEIATSF